MCIRDSHLTYDELVWMRRTVRYSDALSTANLAGMTAATGDQVATLPLSLIHI